MIRRWIIRGFFIALLLLCVGVWVRSSVGITLIQLHAPYNPQVYLENGDFALMFDTRRTQWQLTAYSFELEPVLTTWDNPGSIHWHGFRLGDSGWGVHMISLPLWFPTTISFALLWLVWRKTRPKVNPGTAFPVVVKKAAEGTP